METTPAQGAMGARHSQCNFSASMSPDLGAEPAGRVVSGNEDCLWLNVWTPLRPAGARLPVLVWFHTGAFQAANALNAAAIGERFAQERNVVIVAPNYRLGPFGFLAHGALTLEDPARRSSGNYGLLDQRAALVWVRDHIAAFGGDPQNVTIAGTSAGSHSVSLHLVSPGSGGLFHRARALELALDGAMAHAQFVGDALHATAKIPSGRDCVQHRRRVLGRRPMRSPAPRLQAGQIRPLVVSPPARQHRPRDPMAPTQLGQGHSLFVQRHQLRATQDHEQRLARTASWRLILGRNLCPGTSHHPH
jgi:carboxylesterase type B